MKKSGQLVEVIDGINKGKTGIAYHKDQREEFGDRLAVKLEGKTILIKIDYLKLIGYVD